MRNPILALISAAVFLMPVYAGAAEGLVKVKSAHRVIPGP